MKTVLPGAAIGLFGVGKNSRMFAIVARRMGYRVHVYSPENDPSGWAADVFVYAPYEDLDRVREFAARVDVVTVTDGSVPVIALQAAARCSTVSPSPAAFEAIENGIGAKPETQAARLSGSTAPLAEFSIIGARRENGESAFYQPIAVDRVDGVIDIARSPAAIDARTAKRAIQLTREMLGDLDLTGIACVEWILTQDRELLAGEVTPHPHDSGNLTVDACVASQFEQQLRAVCGLPLGSTEMLRPAAMASLPDAVWQHGEPDWAAACAFPEVKLYLYGARGGHLTAIASSSTRAKQIAGAARASLTRKGEA